MTYNHTYSNELKEATLDVVLNNKLDEKSANELIDIVEKSSKEQTDYILNKIGINE